MGFHQLKLSILLAVMVAFCLPAFSAVECKAVLQEVCVGDCNSERIFNPIRKRFHNVPWGAEFLSPNTTLQDIDLLRRGYVNTVRGNPIEYGVIEFYDTSGRLLDTSGLIQGEHGSIRLNRHFNTLINQYHGRFHEIGRVVKKHTHPLDFENDNPSLTKVFSQPDLVSDQDVVQLLRGRPNLKHIRFESYIIYLNPSWLSSVSSFTPARVLGDFNYVLENNVVKVIGYSP